MKPIRILMALVLAFLLFSGFTVSWDPVTKYTDNTAIGPEAGGVFYNVEMDGSVVVTKTPATSWVLPAVPKKSSHVFREMTVLGTGDNSAWSPPFPWKAPAGSPHAPGKNRVAK